MSEPSLPQSRCRWCREPLHAEARVCPHCARWQGRLAAWLYRLLFQPFAACLIVLCFLGLQGWIMSQVTRPLLTRCTSGPFAEELRVVASEMAPGSLDGEPVLAVVGRLQNEGPNTWQRVALEVQFSDADGRLVDVGRLCLWGQTVPPHGEATFRLTVAPELPAGRYATHEVFVRAARKPNWLF